MPRFSRIVLLALLCAVAMASAQESQLPMAFVGGRAAIAVRDDARLELRLTEEQYQKIRELMQSSGTVKDSQITAGVLEIFERLDEAVKPVLTPEQWKRLEQLWMQYEGPFVLQSPRVANELELSPETQKKVDEVAQDYGGWWRREIGKVRKPNDLARIRNEARKMGRKILGLLTDAQRKRFSEMQGPKFRFRG